MSRTIVLPGPNGERLPYRLQGSTPPAEESTPIESRKVFAAAHVVADPLADIDPYGSSAVDWEATLDFRRYLWSNGLGVAEAMDTAQRGMGLDWDASKELIRRSVAEASTAGGLLASGAGTDHLEPDPDRSLDDVVAAYETQIGYVESVGGRVIVMASRDLAAVASGADDYMAVYSRILAQVSEPVIIHWLGSMFDPALAGYWGTVELSEAIDVVASLIGEHRQKIDGVKVSLLDPALEKDLRVRLPSGVRMYTGDDFNYPELILGDGTSHSDALLGIFDAIAPVAAAALRALDRNEQDLYEHLLNPTVPLARHIFSNPTHAYKTGVVFLAYLNGHQEHFHMVGGQESARSLPHLARLLVLADQAGVLRDPDLALRRMELVLAVAGFE